MPIRFIAPPPGLPLLPGDYTLEFLRPIDLEMGEVQRVNGPSERRIREMAETFDPKLVDIIKVSRERDGRLLVMDGWHRRNSLIDAGFGEFGVLCRVHTDLDIADEALYFDTQSAVKPLSPLDIFTSRTKRDDQQALDVKFLLDYYDYHIVGNGVSTANGGIRAIGEVERIYAKRGYDALDRVLGTIKAVFGKGNGPDVLTLKAFNEFDRAYEGLYDQRRFIRRLKEEGVDELGRVSRKYALQTKPNFRDVAYAMALIYNKSLAQENRLVPAHVRPEKL